MAEKLDRNETFDQDFLEYKRKENAAKASSSFEITSLIDVYDDLLIYWSESGKHICIFEVCFEQKQEVKKIILKTIIPSVSPLFDVNVIKLSSSGHHVLLYGPHGVGVMEFPSKGRLKHKGDKNVLHSRLVQVDESYFNHHKDVKILQAAWYPISHHDKHLIILTNDNCLRFYDLDFHDQPLLRVPLFDHPHHSVTAGSISSYASVFGDLAIGFDIAKFTVDSQDSSVCPIYVMQESGDVWLIKCRFSQHRLQVSQQGPLTMNPPSEDNYGCNYCSLVCLQSEPTVLALATTTGCVHHCLVLETEFDDGFGDTSVDCDGDNTVALYVYETVQLEFNLYEEKVNTDDMASFTNFHLLRDPLDIISYVVVSKGGVHLVSLPWLKDLKHVLAIDCEESDMVELETPAELSFLLCTQPSETSPSGMLCGCSMMRKQTISNPVLLCLMLSGELLALHASQRNNWHGIDSEQDRTTAKLQSPLRNLRNAGDFANHINKILAKNATVPTIRTDGGNEKIPIDTYYKMLTKTTQIIREEYIQKMMQAKIEYKKRCKILEMKKNEQNKEIQYLRETLINNDVGEEIATKLETAQENSVSLNCRIGKLFRNIQRCSPITSNEEKKWGEELKRIDERLKGLRRTVEVVKTKHENALLQELPELHDYPAPGLKKRLQQPTGVLKPSQSIKVRAVLKEQETSISKLVTEVESLRIRVGT